MILVIKAMTITPYIPRITYTILSTSVTQVKSPKPIVVTTAEQHQRASPNLVMTGSIIIMTFETATINNNRP